MASTAPNIWQSVRNFIWLLFGAGCLFIALILWVVQSKKSDVEVIEIEQQAQEAIRPIKSEKLGTDTQLGTMQDEVRPIVLKQRVLASESHGPEFRGSKFLSEHQKFWTLQVMQVTEEDIISSYLEKREDRKKFQYFRLQTEGKPEQFVLTYGSFKSANEVLEKTSQINFQLPEGIKLSPEPFTSYTSLVNDLGADELSSGVKLKTVTLSKAALPVVIQRPQVTSSSSIDANADAGTTTTIRQTDSATQQQKTHTETSKVTPHQPSSLQEQRSTPLRSQNTESQVVDPF